LLNALLDLVARIGYPMVFLGVGIESLGVPVPGETTLVIGAVLAGQGRLTPWLVALVGWAGAVLGDNTGYLIGRRYGRRVAQFGPLRYAFDERRLAVGERFFARHGIWAVFFGRFVALLRILAGPLAGMNRMHWYLFLPANALGGAVWVGAVTAVGVLLGNNLHRAETIVKRAGYIGLALAVVVVAGLWMRHRRQQRRELAEGQKILDDR